MRRKPIVRLGLLLASAFCLLIAPVIAYFSIVRFLEASASVNWPTAEATIIESIVLDSRTGKKASYEPKVRYQYQVAERSRIGTAISANDIGYGVRSEAEAIVNRYAAGSKHPVHYDPDDSANSFLEPGLTWRSYFFLLIPLIMVVASVFLFLVARRY